MARGSVVWHCSKCGNKTGASCQHPGGKYYAVYFSGARQKWDPVSRNKKDAERRLVEILSDIHQGTFSQPKPVLFCDFSEQWLQDYARGAVKPLTFRFYRTMLYTYLNPAFGQLSLTQITPQHVQGFLAKCLKEKHLSPKTTNSLLMTLKTLLKHARQWKHLRENPAEYIKPVRVEPKEMAYLRPDEIQLFLQQADEPYRTVFLAAVLTGMRRGELLGLQWGDIDWHSNLIHVRRTLYYHTKIELAEQPEEQKVKWRFSTPKSAKSTRTIEMSPRLREALELHRLVCPRSSYDLVFCTKDGQPIYAENMVKREFLPALSEAGVRRVRFHDLRHTFTTLLLAQGENIKLIQAQLGHASIQTTLDRYGHLLPEAHQGYGKRLDKWIFGKQHPAVGNKSNPVLR